MPSVRLPDPLFVSHSVFLSCVQGIYHATLCIAVGLALQSSGACAQTPAAGKDAVSEQSYQIPPGALEDVVELFAARAGVSLSFDLQLLSGKHSPGLQGRFSVADGLHKLLEGTGLDGVPQEGNVYCIREQPTPPSLPAVASVKPIALTNQTFTLPAITVTDRGTPDLRDDGYAAQTTHSATRTGTPLAELAQTVQVVTQEVMKDQQTQTVVDALRNVSGITVDESSSNPSIYIRGFLSPFLLDGYAVGVNGLAVNFPVAGLARIEVLKGADSILAIGMPPGGVVNLVRKQPQADTVHDLSMQTGSYGEWLTSLDLAGALTPDKVLTYRFVISGERIGQDTYGYDGKRNFYVAPSLGINYRGMRLVLGFEQNTIRTPTQAYTVLGPNGPDPITSPIGRADDHQITVSTSIYYDLEKSLSKIWSFQSKAEYARYVNSSSTYWLDGVANLPGTVSNSPGSGVLGGLDPYAFLYQYYSWSTEQNLTAKFRTGSLSQTLIAGFTYQQQWVSGWSGSANMSAVPLTGTALPPVTPPSSYSDFGKNYDSNLFVQDQLALDRLHILLSIGHPQQWGQQLAAQSAWTPNFGILFQITPNISIYANALRSFYSQANMPLVQGGLPPPAIGRSNEIGLKFSLLDGRFLMSTALFRAAQQNSATQTPSSGALFTLSPGNVSRGLEIDATGSLLPGLKLISHYTYATYLDAQNGFSQLPKHQASVWLTYDLQGESWHGWGVGAGIWARSAYLAQDVNGPTYPMPGQARTDASLYYKAKNWSSTLGIKNIFNRRLYGDYASALFVEQEPGRLIYLTGNYSF